MFNNYLKIAFRNITRNKINSFINIFGLALGLSASFIMLLIVEHEFSYDQHNENIDRVGRIIKELGEFKAKNSLTPFPLAKALIENFPEVENAASAISIYPSFAYRDKIIEKATVYSVDTTLTNILTYNLVKGNPKHLFKNKDWILISESKAKKYFGNENPIGKILEINLRGEKYSLSVSGVYKDIPETATFASKMLVPINIGINLMNNRNKRDGPNAINSWGMSKSITFYKLQNSTQFQAFMLKLKEFSKKQAFGSREDILIPQKLSEIYLNSEDIGDPHFVKGDKQKALIYTVIAFLILAISIVNYIMLSITKLMSRVFEIGVRKVIGVTKSSLIFQITTESILTTLLAIPFSFLLIFLVVDEFSNILGVDITLAYIDNISTYIGFIILALGVSVFSGIIISNKIANLNTSLILQNKLIGKTKKIKLRHVFVLLEMTIFVGLIIGAISVKFQVDYLRNKNLGFNKENVVILSLKKEKERYSVFKESLLKNPNIVNVSAAVSLPPRKFFMQMSIQRNDEIETKVPLVISYVSFDYLNTMGLQLVKGRDFNSILDRGFLLNETAAEDLNVGDDMIIKQHNLEVIGILKDFNFQPLHGEVKPCAIRLISDKSLQEIVVRFKGEDVSKVINDIKVTWGEIFPDTEMNYHFFDEVIDKLYKKEQNFSTVINVFTSLALFITCLGLLGLIMFISQQRTKEIGIRKVLGASAISIINLLSREFVVLVIVSNFIAGPIAYYIINEWLNNFAYRIDLGMKPLLITIVFSLIITLGTVGVHVVNATMNNPVDSLRNE